MVQNTFHRLVLSGHHAAINFLCIFPRHVLSFAEPTVAEMVCLFNCMAHTGPREDEEILIVESTSRKLDNVLWSEIYAASYGKAAARETSVALIDEAPRQVYEHKHRLHSHDLTSRDDVSCAGDTSSELAGPSKRQREGAHWMSHG